jgi:2-polyprenyl-6-hydroxyphenyl methylase/3-demethylubiquinone-9 3-methyltransferase
VSENSVRCAEDVRARFGYDADRWAVRHGSVLDRAFVESLPVSEVVYAWGVLHHTGDMALAFEHACSRVAVGGVFHTAIYNRVWTSPAWAVIKRVYNDRGPLGRLALHGSFFTWNAAARAVGLKHPFKRERGMSVWYDAVDWLGGYPYEYATHDEVVAMVNRHGRFTLLASRRDSGFGCNEFVFAREG